MELQKESELPQPAQLTQPSCHIIVKILLLAKLPIDTRRSLKLYGTIAITPKDRDFLTSRYTYHMYHYIYPNCKNYSMFREYLIDNPRIRITLMYSYYYNLTQHLYTDLIDFTIFVQIRNQLDIMDLNYQSVENGILFM